MPELPEVETTRRGIEPHLSGKIIQQILIRESRMRWPIPDCLPEVLTGQKIDTIQRRGKYLLVHLKPSARHEYGVLILHLGMSGSLRITSATTPLRKHDHFILQVGAQKQLRLHDPRRFGAVLWQAGHAEQHPLLAHLGPEPLEADFNANYLYGSSQGRKTAIKQHLMNGKVVVGIGNIYANEALFLSGIHPKRAAGRIGKARMAALVIAAKQVLTQAIEQGGTTLKDFVNEKGEPGYFKQSLHVYGREGMPCTHCGAPVRHLVLGQRATFYCTQCQH